MQEIIDTKDFETMGFAYTDREAKVASFALKMYRLQLTKGNIPYEPEMEFLAIQAMEAIDDLLKELESGILTIPAQANEAIRSIFLPYVVRMYEGLPVHMCEGVCRVLEVRPFELAINALEAKAMLAEEIETAIVQWEAD